MRRKALRSIASKAAIVMTIIVAFGCASNRINLVDNDTVTIELLPSERVYVYRVNVYQDSGDVVIFGKLKRHYNSTISAKGHVDLALMKPDGTVSRQFTASYSPQLTRKRRTASFSVNLPDVTLPQGTILKVGYHRG